MVLNAVTRLGYSLTRNTSAVNATLMTRPYAPAVTWYDYLEAYADNRPYDDATTLYRTKYGLTKGLQAIYNPAHRLINWYAGHCYPTGYGDIPFDANTAETLQLPVRVAFTWGNMQQQTSLYVKTGAKLGNVLVTVESDVASGRVYPRVLHPRYARDIELDHRANVIGYRLEIPRYDPVERTSFRWGLIVTRESFTTLYNDDPYGYDGNDATTPNPFGFVPAVWVPHEVTGELLGAPAIDGLLGKIDRLNSIATAAHQFIEKLSKQGVVFATDSGSKIKPLDLSGSGNLNAEAQEIRYLVAPGDTTIGKMLDDIGLSPSLAWAQSAMEEIDKDTPEIALEQQIQSMNNLSGIAALRLISVGNVISKLADAQRNYDWGLIRIGQMCVSMGAMLSHARVGGWANQTAQQQVFNVFDAGSFDRGDLEFTFADRPLLPETPMERAQSAAARMALTTPQALSEAGYTAEEIYGVDAQDHSLAPPAPAREGILAQQEALALRQQSRSVLNFNSGVGTGG